MTSRPWASRGRHHLLAAFEAVQPGEFAGLLTHGTVIADDLHTGQLVAVADFEVVGIVGRGHLQGACAELQIDIGVLDDGDSAVHQGQDDLGVAQVRIAFILRMDGHRRIPQHGFRPGGGHHKTAVAFGKGITDMIQPAVQILMLHFQIGQGRLAARTPVGDIQTFVNQALFVKLDEDGAHRPGQALVHGEPFPRPVAGGSQALELIDDGAAGLFPPLPDGVDEFFAAQLMAVDAFGVQLAFHHVLGGDAGVVRTRHPEDIIAFQPPVAAQDVLHGVVEGVAHMQNPGDIGRGDDNGKRTPLIDVDGPEEPLLFPVSIPFSFHGMGFVAFV